MLKDILAKSHKTYKYRKYYISGDELPKKIIDAIDGEDAFIEESSYTAWRPAAFIRKVIQFPDGAAEFEVSLGSLDEFEEAAEESEDRDEYLQGIAEYLKENFDWLAGTIYIRVWSHTNV